MELRSFSLTHIQFEKNDKLGELMAFSSLIPIFLVVAETVTFVSRREVAGLLFLIGQLSNEVFNTMLKSYFRESRPAGLGTGYGMPSSHSQFMGYFLIYFTTYINFKTRISSSEKLLATILVFIFSFMVTASRVYLGYHTLKQVIVGFSVGMLYGFLWDFFVEVVLRDLGFVDIFLHSMFARLFYIRDSRSVENIIHAEYKVSRSLKTL